MLGFVLSKVFGTNLNYSKKLSISKKRIVKTEYKIPCKDIQQLFVESDAERTSMFLLSIKMNDDTVLQPFYPFIDVKEVYYIEQMIERFLQIKDIRDPKEIRL